MINSAQQQFISETQTSIINYLDSPQYSNAWQSFVPQTQQHQEQEEEVVLPQQSDDEKGSDEDLSR